MASSCDTEDEVKGDKYRSHIYGEGEKNTKWRFGAPPNYDVVNKLFEEGRTQEWPNGSLEERVQNLVKTWEMELVHKMDPADYKTVNTTNFTISINGGKPLLLQEVRKIGSYNLFLQTSLPQNLRVFDPSIETPESSHQAFITTFPRGFAVEILQVYSGPPVIAYKFRHWAFMEGPFKGHAPTGEMAQFHGIGIFHVDEMMRVEKVEFFYDPNELLASLVKSPLSNDSEASTNSSSSAGCPFFNKLTQV
ncbi:PREDICTED: pathogen-related protein-like [Nelumbo nucifera]|uniref:Pathogen-related protein-like n=1 Tax=Nelumbo nucifera TaxID=4432 RepID=A0A1U7YX31_NELNU|nr:PREDICTED: pathogen-related protein-like [Nelumbo nucifera]